MFEDKQRSAVAFDHGDFIQQSHHPHTWQRQRFGQVSQALLATERLWLPESRIAEARTQAASLLGSRPDVRCTDVLSLIPLRDERAAAQYMDLLKAAGVPG